MDVTRNSRNLMLTLVRHNGPLRRLLAALAVSQLGDWLYNLALVAFVYDRTGSVTWVAVTTAARVLPMVVLGPLGGIVADRYDRRRLMILSDLVRVATMALLAVVVVAGLPVLLAPLLALISTVATTVYPPCVAATMPRLVADDDLPTATAARVAIQAGSVIIGPAGGAVLLLLGSPALAFLINALTFAASAAIIVGMPAGALFAPAAPDSTTARDCDAAGTGVAGVGRELRAGVDALRRNPLAGRLVGADIMSSFVYGAQTVLLLLLGEHLGYGAAGYGYLLAAIGVGAVIGAGLAGRLAVARHPRRAVGAVLLALAVPSALLAVTPWLFGALLLCVVMGAASVMVEIVADTALARAVDESVLARVYGLAFPASIGGIVLGSIVAAPLVTAVGLSWALVLVGGAVLGYAIFLSRPAVPGRRPAPRMIADDVVSV